MRRFGFHFCFLLVLLIGPAGLLVAQETTGAIAGTVMDASGALVPGAKVEASAAALIRPMVVTTAADGAYAFMTLPPGSYTLTVTAAGFRTLKQPGIEVRVGRQLRSELRLEVGQITESVVVTGESVIVDTSQSTSAVNVNQGFFDTIPKGRSFESLIALAPGARNEPRGGGFQIDGASPAENIYVVDGMDVTNLQTGALPTQSKLPTEFIQELQVKSSGFDAQYGGAMGGVVNAIIRSGSNEFHGQGSLYLATDGANAGPRPTLRLDPFDDNKSDFFHNSRDGYRLFNPGVSIGGPIKKDKLWFFASSYPEFRRYERTVKFLSAGNPVRTYERKERNDYLTAKIDVAPTSRARAYIGYLYTPAKVNGLLPSRQGTDPVSSPWADRGSRSPGASMTFGGDYNFTSKLLASVRGGYNYRNNMDYGIPRGVPRYRFMNSNTSIADIPANLKGPAGNFTADNRQTVTDIQTRWRLSADVSYLFNAGGQHNLKLGYETNRLHNEPLAGTWPDGYFLFYWNTRRQGITVPGSMIGKYGYFIYRFFATEGNVASNNTGVFIQDQWRATKRLTLNLGLRTEREFLPSFKVADNIPSRAIEFGFGSKLAPRLGFAYDVMGDGKTKIFGAFGLFYDTMKYEMPRGSFGGDKWKDYVYPLDDYDFFKLKAPTPLNGPLSGLPKPFEIVDWRIPSNDPEDNTIDKDLKPMRRRVWDIGLERSIGDTMAFNIRYTHNSLDRAIEDVGILTDHGEVYYIANPGFGLTANPKTWEPGFPVTPKARRDYDAVEARLEKRFSRNYTFAASYTWSRLWGNYGGLASADENARFSPNVNRYFDLPFMSWDKSGKEVLGLLATDRPHSFKFFGSYTLKSKAGSTNFGPVFIAQSGTPLTTEVTMVSSTPIFVNGRGDLGRTAVYSQTDFLLWHEFNLSPKYERLKIKLDMNVSNLFNHATAVNSFVGYLHGNDGQVNFAHEADFFKGFDYVKLMRDQKLRTDPRFRLPNDFLNPRDLRFGFHFIF